MFNIFKKTSYIMLKQMYSPYKIKIVVLSFLGFLRGLLDGVGITALIPVFAFVAKDDTYGSDVITRYIKYFFDFFNITFRLKYLIFFIILLFLIKFVVVVFIHLIQARISAGYEAQSRKDLYKRMMFTDWSFIHQQKIGYLENVLMTDVAYGRAVLQKMSNMAMTFSSLVIYLLVALNISITITLLTVGFGLILFICFRPLLIWSRKIGRDTTKYNKLITNHVNEYLLGIKTIKAMSLENYIVRVAAGFFENLRKLRIKSLIMDNIVETMLQPLSLIFIVAIFGFSYNKPDFSIAAFAVVIFLVQRIFQYINQLQNYFQSINESIPYLVNIFNYSVDADKNKEIRTGLEDVEFKKNIRFEKVFFSYNQTDVVLGGVDFDLVHGQMLGLVGSSGSGKTTIVDLLLRLHEPTKGKIMIDDGELSSFAVEAWRKKIGYVSQDIFLFNDTIEANIGFYDETISEKQIVEACKMANIYDFIQSSPEGLSTMVGERGTNLSVGQRQRIVIARVLAHNPEVLIFDEATSGLDNETELSVKQAIFSLKGKITILVVAHRLTTVLDCDQLIVLEDGKIIEQGVPKDLLNDQNSYFSKMYNINRY